MIPKGLEEISGIGKKTAERLKSAGITTVQKLADMTINDLMALDIKGIGKATAEKYLEDAKKAVAKLEDMGDNDNSEESIDPSVQEASDQIYLTEEEKKSNTLRILSKFFKADVVDINNKDDRKILKEIIEKPIESFRFISNKEANFIKTTLMISKIGELLNFKEKNIFNFVSSSQLKIVEKDGVNVKDLFDRIEKAITISSILSQLYDKKIELRKEQQKVIIAGLDKAGKTAILQTFGGRLGITDLTKLRPTKKVHRRKIQTDDLLLYLWDFGGQTKYRHEYLRNPGSYFLSVDLMIYVIDIQDYHRFEEAFSYFGDILEALNTLEEKPQFLVFLHKYDPDVRDNPEVQLNIEYLKENLKDILFERNFDYEIYLTSIYTFISREPKFTKFLKQMVSQNDLVADPTSDKLEELGKIVDNALNAIIKLSESISEQFSSIGNKFDALEQRIRILESTQQIGSQEILQAIPQGEQKDKTLAISKAESKSMIDQLLARSSSGAPGLPSLDFGKLHPPPPTPVLSSSNTLPNKAPSGPTLRGTIIDELKELFTKVKKQDY